MITLGLNQDRFDCGVCLCRDGELVFAANEERYTRQKSQGGFPHRALQAALASQSLDAAQIDRVCVAGIATPPLPARVAPDAYERWSRGKYGRSAGWSRQVTDWLLHHTPLAHSGPDSAFARASAPLCELAVRASLPPGMRGASLSFVEHHRAHSAGGFGLSGFERALCVTADGMGDGRSLTVSLHDQRGATRLWSAGSHDSLGLLFEAATEALGFIPCRHEGKLVGLAAHGDATRVGTEWPFELTAETLRYRGPHGLAAVRWLAELSARSSREDLCAWLQRGLELTVCSLVERFMADTSESRLVVAGGVFANVKLNQALHALPCVEELFVHPNMGDGGLALGAVCASSDAPLAPVRHVMLGDRFSDDAIAQAIRRAKRFHERPDDIELALATEIAAGKLVARFAGAMEWGPRALGNRSILARSDDPGVPARLNRMLGRNDFMPFAPALRVEDAARHFVGLSGAERAAEHMTLCVDATDVTRRLHPAVVHVDGSARIQLVHPQHNPSFHRLLSCFASAGGGNSGMLLNTSFNLHDEPIVRSPEDALRSFAASGLDRMAMGPFLVRQNG